MSVKRSPAGPQVIKADKSDLETLFFRRMQLIISPVFSAWRNNKMHCSWNSHEFCRAQSPLASADSWKVQHGFTLGPSHIWAPAPTLPSAQ
ncbi:uncharacterized protein RHO17_015798 isoform 9-T9 [Thomomys bottae]